MEYRSEHVSMWFDRRLVMRASRIQGTGVFATDAIRAGERLYWVSGGVVYTSEDWRSGKVHLDPEQYNEEQIGDDLFVATPKAVGYYINHSCEPNVLNNVAWRDIAPGEEVTCDYASAEADPNWVLEPCLCGSALCRGRVTGNDWKIPALQQRYRGYFTPRIEGLIRGLQPQG
jgi:uncharacterized protein